MSSAAPRAVLVSALLLLGCGGGGGWNGSHCRSSPPASADGVPVSTMIPMTADVMRAFRPMPPPWRDLDPSILVLPWHRAVLGEPKHARASWLPVAPSATAAGPCDAYTHGFGELEVLYANDAPDITTASTIVIGENVQPAAAAQAEALLEPARAMPNGWSERPARGNPALSLFTRPGRPWICASGAAVRDRLRALLAQDPRLPILIGLPIDVSMVVFTGPGATTPSTAQWSVSVLQLDRDARQQAAEISCTQQLPRGFRTFVQNRTHYADPAIAKAAFFKAGPPSEQALVGPDTYDRDVVNVQ